MVFYSFESLQLDYTGYYNLFEKTTVNIKNNRNLDVFTVTEEFKGRLDLVCRFLHGSTDYMEEIMTINHIINPYSLKQGVNIKYFSDTNNYQLLYQSDPDDNNKKNEILLMNKDKQSKKDANRIGSPPTIRPDNLKQIDVNHSKKKITIMNKFK